MKHYLVLTLLTACVSNWWIIIVFVLWFIFLSKYDLLEFRRSFQITDYQADNVSESAWMKVAINNFPSIPKHNNPRHAKFNIFYAVALFIFMTLECPCMCLHVGTCKCMFKCDYFGVATSRSKKPGTVVFLFLFWEREGKGKGKGNGRERER